MSERGGSRPPLAFDWVDTGRRGFQLDPQNGSGNINDPPFDLDARYTDPDRVAHNCGWGSEPNGPFLRGLLVIKLDRAQRGRCAPPAWHCPIVRYQVAKVPILTAVS